MSIGPLQLVIIGIDKDKYARNVVLELQEIRKQGVIRLFDMLYLIKHENGTIAAKEISDLTSEEKREYGTLANRLLGLGTEAIQHDNAEELAASLGMAETEFGLSQEDIQNLADQIPNNSSAILILFEHHWALHLRETIINAGGKLLANGYINPDTLQIASHELASVLDAVRQVEAQAIDEATVVKAQAKAEAKDAKLGAAAAVAQAEATAEEAAAVEKVAHVQEKEAMAEAAKAQALAKQIKQAAALEALAALRAADLIEEEAEKEAM